MIELRVIWAIGEELGVLICQSYGLIPVCRNESQKIKLILLQNEWSQKVKIPNIEAQKHQQDSIEI
jgi:hypothetical protein